MNTEYPKFSEKSSTQKTSGKFIFLSTLVLLLVIGISIYILSKTSSPINNPPRVYQVHSPAPQRSKVTFTNMKSIEGHVTSVTGSQIDLSTENDNITAEVTENTYMAIIPVAVTHSRNPSYVLKPTIPSAIHVGDRAYVYFKIENGKQNSEAERILIIR